MNIPKPTRSEVLLFTGIVTSLATPFATIWALRKVNERKNAVKEAKYAEKVAKTKPGETVTYDESLNWKEKVKIYAPLAVPLATTLASAGSQIGLYFDGQKNAANLMSLMNTANATATTAMSTAEKYMEADKFAKFKREVEDRMEKREQNPPKRGEIGLGALGMTPGPNLCLFQDPVTGVKINSTWSKLREITIDLKDLASRGSADGISGTDICYRTWLEEAGAETMPADFVGEEIIFPNAEGFRLMTPSRFDLFVDENNNPYCKLRWEKDPIIGTK